jgi:hypothetical protein
MKAGRWLLLVIPPVAFGITGMLHLVAARGGPGAGGEFQKIMRHADLWIAIHIVQIAIICLLAGTVLVLARGLRSRAAAMARVAVVPFAAFYSAFDAVAGLSNGLLASYAQHHPAQAGVLTDASSALDPLEEPAIALVYAIGVACWPLAGGGSRSRCAAMPPPSASFSLGPVRPCSRSTTPLPSGRWGWRCSSRAASLRSWGARPQLAMLAANGARSGSSERPGRHKTARW